MRASKMAKAWGILIFISLYLYLPEAAAQSDLDSAVIRDLNPVVVTGTRFEQQKSNVPGSISVITRNEIEQNGNVNILPVLASHVPGMFLNNRSLVGFGVGPNSGGNISIRGISGTPNSRVLVLIDGQPQFMGIFAHPIADAYSSSDIEKVEVVRGAASLLYGSNAMGGAINLITRKAEKEGWQGSARMGYGSYNTGVFSGTLGYNKEKLNSFISVNRTRTDGYRSEGRDDFNNTTAYFRIGYALREELELSADLQVADARYYHPGTTDNSLDNDRRDYLRGRAAISLKNSFEKVDGGLFLFYNWGDHNFMEGFRSNDINKGLTFFQNFSLFEGNTVTLGLDHKNFGGKAENDNLPPPARIGIGERHEVNETDLYINFQQQFFKRFTFNGGVRWVNNSIFGDMFLPGFGLNFQAGEGTLFKTLYSTGFRSPALVDLFLFPTSNRHLQPEEVSNFELGVRQVFLNKSLELELTGFINEGKNLIQVVPVPVPPQAFNTGSFSNKGLEAMAKWHYGNKFNAVLNYSRIDVSENILYSPRQMINFQWNYTGKKISGTAEIQQINGLRNSIMLQESLENYNLVNLRGRYQITRGFQVFLDINNLLNTFYEVENGYPMPGFNLLGGVNVKF